MSQVQARHEGIRDTSGFGLFLRRWLANPLQMGALVPSSPALCRLVAAQVRRAPDEWVIELGAGTGAVSRALLEAGVPAGRISLVEIIPEMAAHLRAILRGVEVLDGDARALPELVPRARHGSVGTVICGVPLVMLPLAEQRRFVAAMQAVAPGRGFLHYSYCFTSPLPWRRLGLTAKREAWTPRNLPPASVWRYTPA
ncbi:MAG TPA: methyltransferase domain-containing protein [Acetobacteraceae bacterium]|nr:methyltransferase domain-containing protein [Acetobacteraceae bacterium]